MDGGTPSGTVTLTSNGNPIPECPSPVTLVGGVALCTTESLPAGQDLIAAHYNGDSMYLPSSASMYQVVTKGFTATVLTSSPNPSNLKCAVTFTAKVVPQYPGPILPTGTVDFTYNGTPIPDCTGVLLVPQPPNSTASCKTTTLPLGSDVVTAIYHGDNNFLESLGSETQGVQVGPNVCTSP
jgi:hypothetical protein